MPPSRGRRMRPRLASNPHRFHKDRSEIAQDLSRLPGALCARPSRSSGSAPPISVRMISTTSPQSRGAAGGERRRRRASAAGGCLRRWRSTRGKSAGLRQTLAMADKLTDTVERHDGGKFRCTGATSSDAVVIYPGEALALVNIERQVLPSAPRLPRSRTAEAGPGPPGVPAWHDPAVVVPAVPVARAGSDAEHSPEVPVGTGSIRWRSGRAAGGADGLVPASQLSAHACSGGTPNRG